MYDYVCMYLLMYENEHTSTPPRTWENKNQLFLFINGCIEVFKVFKHNNSNFFKIETNFRWNIVFNINEMFVINSNWVILLLFK